MPGALRQKVWLGVATGIAGFGATSEAAGASGGMGAGGAAGGKGLLAVIAGSSVAKGVVAVVVLVGAALGVGGLRSSAPRTPVVTSFGEVQSDEMAGAGTPAAG